MNDTIKTAAVAFLSAAIGALLMLALVNGRPPATSTNAGLVDQEALLERIAALEQRIPIMPAMSALPAEALGAEAVALGETPGGPGAATESEPGPAVSDRRAERLGSRLRDAGWTDTEIDSLEELREKAALQLERQRYEAMRRNLQDSPDELDRWRDRRTLMRDMLGEEKYEQYLEAAGRPTAAEIRSVLTGSAGHSAGLQPGDRIRSYGSMRVYDDMDLVLAQLDGERGEAVSVEIVRDGTVFYVTVPRGPLGVSRPSRLGLDF